MAGDQDALVKYIQQMEQASVDVIKYIDALHN